MSLPNVPGNSNESEEVLSAVSPGDAQAWRELALDSLMSGEPASGLWFLRNAIEVDAEDPLTWQLMGRCFEEMGEEARARKCFLLALRQDAHAISNAHARSSTTLAPVWRRLASRDI